jgi:hypothetical protein
LGKNINVMTKFDNKFVPGTPKTYEVRYLESENKQSKLSPAARGKVVNFSGSNYVSERVNDLVPTYGPCTRSDCTHSFYLKLTIGYEGNFGANGYYFARSSSNNSITAITHYSIGQAKETRDQLARRSL